jgi:hypothetical protein
VPEQVSNRAHSCAFTLKLDGEGVTNSVGMHSLIDPRLSRKAWKQVTHIALVDVATLQRAEDNGTAVNPPLPSYLEPVGKERRGSDIDAHDSTFIALAVLDDDHPGVKINVLRPQG